VNEQTPHPTETPGQTPTGRPQVGWGFWVLWVLALAAVGTLSYCLGSLVPLSNHTLPPATMVIFGFLAGGVQGLALKQQLPPVRRWIQASSLAGLVAACISILPTGLAATSVGLYAGWAYAWAAYGAVLGVMLQRVFPGRRWMLTSLAGWATAGIVSGAVGWVSDVLRVSGTTALLFLFPSSLSQTWPIEGLISKEETLMVRRALILLTLFVLPAWAMSGCSMGGSTEDMESTIVARVVATLESAETAPAATQAPPGPTATPVPEPTAIPVPTATPVPEPTAIPEPTVTPPPEIETEEYAVYSAMIQQNPVGFNLGSSILIREQTVAGLNTLEMALERAPRLPAGLVDSYRSRNAALYTLDPNLDVELDHALIPEEEFAEILRRGGSDWVKFYETYPEASGVVSFSRVGFGANEDEALVLMGYVCGDLCGAGGLYLLVKEEGSWKIQESLIEWIS
jgi:hypothetical protein